MKTFVNDEKMIGKWKKLGVVQRKEDYKNKNFDDNEIFNFPEIYFLPNGEKYWVFSWTKGILYLKDRPFPYEIIDGKMFVGIVDEKTNTIDNYAIYEKENDKHYSKEEIAIKDDTNIPFIMDKEVVGSWVSVDFVANIKDFELNKKQYKQNLFLKKLVFEKDGKLYLELDGCSVLYSHTWSKGFFINKMSSTVSEYYIKNILGIDIMFIEWKSGDYTFGGKIRGYYVLQRL